MKKVYVVILLNIICMWGNAQNFQWAKREGKWAYDYGYGIATDNNGNVYVSGKYEENGAYFSGYTVTCSDNHDMFLAKYASDGAIQWVRTGGGNLGDYSETMACDGANYVYVAGEIEGYGNVITFPGSTASLTCVGDNDIFIVKYDLDGNLIWAKSDGWYKSEKALGITYDNSGNIFICGYFSDTTKINGTQIIGAGGRDIYVAKYDANGVFQWIKTAGSSGRDEAKSVKCDAAGNVYIAGMMSNGVNFGAQTLTCSPNYYDAFVAKYSPTGNLLWVKKGGGDYDDVAWSLVLDSQEKIYVTGEFNAYALFGTNALTTTGNANVFVVSYDASGNELWAKGAGGSLNDRARGIGTDGTNLFITGQFGSTAYFDSHSITAVDSSDVFIVALNNSGSFKWATSVGGPADIYEPLGYESGIAVCAQPSGNVYVTGGLLDGGTFGSMALPAFSRTDIFVTMLNSEPVGITERNGVLSIGIYPNPGNGVFVLNFNEPQKNVEVSVFNPMGQLIQKVNNKPSPTYIIDLTTEPEGVYFAEVKSGESVIRKKLIVQH